MSDADLDVLVVSARPEGVIGVPLRLAAGATVADALAAAAPALGEVAPVDDAPVGIFGRVVPRSTPLSAGDRVELYRPLAADPKETRRRLAREGRTMGSRRG